MMKNKLKNNMDTVEFLPVEVVKPFMSLTVGDILRVNINTGRYELRSESEDIGDKTYSHEKYEISLEPWLIEKYFDHFQIYEDKTYEGINRGLSNESLDAWRSSKGDISLNKEEKEYFEKQTKVWDDALPKFNKECELNDKVDEKTTLSAGPDETTEEGIGRIEKIEADINVLWKDLIELRVMFDYINPSNKEVKYNPIIPENLENLQKNCDMESIECAAEELAGKVESGKEIDILRQELAELKEMFDNFIKGLLEDG